MQEDNRRPRSLFDVVQPHTSGLDEGALRRIGPSRCALAHALAGAGKADTRAPVCRAPSTLGLMSWPQPGEQCGQLRQCLFGGHFTRLDIATAEPEVPQVPTRELRELGRDRQVGDRAGIHSEPRLSQVDRAVEQIEARYAEPLDVETLGRSAAMSRYHCSRRFHRATRT